jgi:hypothetical protein
MIDFQNVHRSRYGFGTDVDLSLGNDAALRCSRLAPHPWRAVNRTGSNVSRMALGLPTNLWRADLRRREFIAGLAGTARSVKRIAL